MKTILYFYLDGCPHCARADRMLQQLLAQPAYAQLNLRRIEESQQSALANSYDYYYVPCLWLENGPKLHEGVPSEEKLRAALDAALQG